MSKLSLHCLNGFGADELAYLRRVRPPMVKLVGAFGHARTIKDALPGVQLVGRVVADGYEPQPDNAAQRGDPERHAEAFLNAWVLPQVAAHPLIEVWEAANEPTVSSPEAMRWYARWSLRAGALLAGVGKRPALGGFAVGNPDLPESRRRLLIQEYVPVLRLLADTQGYLNLHEYSNLSTSREGWYHRRYNWWVGLAEAQGLPVRILLGEMGLDHLPPVTAPDGRVLDGGVRPWRLHFAGGLAERELAYADLLGRWARDLDLDPYVHGAFIFTSGGQGWPDHMTSGGLLERLAERLELAPPPVIGEPEPAPTPSPAPATPEVVNGSFEDAPDGRGWEFYVVRTSAPEKNPIFRIERAEKGASPLSRSAGNAGGQIYGEYLCWRAGLRQRLAVAPGQRYRLTASARLWMRPDGRFDLHSEPMTGPDAVSQALALRVRGAALLAEREWVDTNGRWNTYGLEFTADQALVTIELEADLGGPQSRWRYEKSAACFDAVAVAPVVATPPVPPPPVEQPLFTFNTQGHRYRLYADPDGATLITTLTVTWPVDVYEMRQGAWRVSRAGSEPYWLRVGV